MIHRLRLTCLLLIALALTGCSAASHAADASGTQAVRLSDVTPVADPRGWEGPSTARTAASSMHPVDGAAPVLPTAVVDAQGTPVTVADTSRILTLDVYGTLSRIVYELGFGDEIVGRDVSSDFPEIADRSVVTRSGHDLSAEAILAVDPTVVITDTSLGPWDVILQLRDAGIPVVVVDSARTTGNVDTLITQVSAALGVADRGKQLAARSKAAIDDKIAEIRAIAPQKTKDRLRIAFLYVRGQAGVYYLFGQGTGAQSLITALGGIDVATEIGWKGMRPVTDEGLVDARPDLILMMSKGLESVGGVDGLLDALPAVAQTPAGQHRRIVDMDDAQILSFGPETADVLDALAVAVYAPDADR